MLEATMKQRFPWMVLLLVSGLFGPSFCGLSEDKQTCDSDGIVGTFSADQKLNSLTITPVNFTKDLEVQINTTIVGGTSDQGIQLYLTLDDESACTELKAFKFQIVSIKSDSAFCEFTINWNPKSSLQIDAEPVFTDLSSAYNDPQIALFEVRREGGIFKTVVTYVSGEPSEKPNVNECIDIDETSIRFKLKVPEPAEKAKIECGVQLEMRGDYQATSLGMDKLTNCTLEQPGTSNDDHDMSTIATTTDKAQEEGFPVWAIIVISIVGALIVIVAVLLIVFCVILPKRKAASGDDVEDVADAPELETGLPDDLVQTAEEIQD